jgi:hypothetical protein
MPRQEIDLPCHIEYLSILEEQGQAGKTLLPDLAGEELQRFHRTMLLSRRFDERLLSLQRQGGSAIQVILSVCSSALLGHHYRTFSSGRAPAI